LIWRQSAAAPLGQPPLSGAPYIPVAVEAPTVKRTTWDSPAPLARGRDWIYDVFTPPEIFYSSRTRQFAVSAPSNVADDAPEAPFGLELVGVRPSRSGSNSSATSVGKAMRVGILKTAGAVKCSSHPPAIAPPTSP